MTLMEHKDAGHTITERGIDNYGTDGGVALYMDIDTNDGFGRQQCCIPIMGGCEHNNDEDGNCNVCGGECRLYETYDYDNSEVVF